MKGGREMMASLRLRALVAHLTPETRGLARDSFILTLGTGIAGAGYMAQIALITHFLGLEKYGVLAVVISLVAIIDRFFDVQVGDATIALAAGSLRSNPRAAAGLVQVAYVIDFVAGIAGFMVILVLAYFLASPLVGTEGPSLTALYAITLLASTVDTTSLSLLRLLDRFKLILAYVALRETLRVGFLIAALVIFADLVSVVLALVLLDVLMGVAGVLAAVRMFGTATGIRLHDRSHFASREARRPLLNMIFHTNFVAYAKIVAAQGPALLLGVFHNPTQAGAFKVGSALASTLGQLSDPAWAAIMPRLSRLWSARQIDEVRRLLVQSTALVLLPIGALGLFVVVFREPLLRVFAGPEATVATTVVVLGVLQKLVTGTFFWNTSVLYVAERAKLASQAHLLSAATLAPLLVVLSMKFGANGAALALLLWSIQLNLLLTVAAARLVRADGLASPVMSRRTWIGRW